jgi:hypothetical protein
MNRVAIILCGGVLALTAVAFPASAAEAGKPFDIGGQYSLTPPGSWIVKQPKSNIVEYEFEVPVAEGDEIPGRITVMGAGGGVAANVDRWKGQFKTPETGEVAAEVKQIEAGGLPVHMVDIKGTYLDKPGPFVPGPGIERPNYRMLGAIIETKDAGQYFVKFYGPDKTVTANETGFKKMIDALEAK